MSEGARSIGVGQHVAIIGGSLAGLAAARVLHATGYQVTVFERAGEGFASRGGGLGIDLRLVTAVGGEPPPPHLRLSRRLLWRDGRQLAEPAAEDVTAYGALWRWLANGLPPACLRFDADVRALDSKNDCVTVTVADGARAEFALAICADGGRGAGRTWVERELRAPRYAGYVLWRGLCAREAFGGAMGALDALSIFSLPGQHFVAYPIPTYTGTCDFESQLLNWGWYVPTPSATAARLLVETGRNLVPHAFTSDPLPLAWSELLAASLDRWPIEVRELIEATLANGRVVPHPVYEVMPGELARERVALVGDVAHQASPITGSGARLAMADALALGAALGSDSDPIAALTRYAQQRTPDAAAVVTAGFRAGRAFACEE